VNSGTLIFDTEVYKNYFLLMFLNTESGKLTYFEKYNDSEIDLQKIRKILQCYKIIGFNSINFDIPLIFLLLSGATNGRIKECSDAIIQNGLKPWIVENKFRFRISNKIDHIDIIEVAPGKGSLKIYGGRLHSQKIQDLPIDPEDVITDEMTETLRKYCGNDLKTTEDLYKHLLPQIELREEMSKQYEIDLRSKSDAQIAEAVIKHSIEQKTGVKLKRPEIKGGTVIKYKPPSFIKFSTPVMQEAADRLILADYKTTEGGKILMPDGLDEETIKFCTSEYRIGMGGLHSCETCTYHESDDYKVIRDFDVKSYYPAIILNCNLYPRHLGENFLSIYKSIVARRLEAKASGDKVTAESLKITANGSFGKFGSKWSVLYSPDLLIQTTITGQLTLLMLIEMMEEAGADVISANTDGVVVKHARNYEEDVNEVIKIWQKITGFETEETRYKGLYSRDVNSYIAIKEEGGIKLKGAYTPAGLQKNPTNEICTDAIIKWLKTGESYETTIRECQDVRKFITIRAVKGGATKNGDYLGRAVRWYYAKGETGVIQYKLNGYTVARTEGAKPLMELPEKVPRDLDYEWYVKEAETILEDIGWV
jgi:DNA polymerase elongation subunit (family B)